MNSPPPQTLAEAIYYVRADLFRYTGATGWRSLARVYFRRPGFRFTFWLRLASYLRGRPGCRPLYWIAEMQRSRYEIKYGISISNDTPVGPGLCIGHFGGIVVNGESRIGRNCDLLPGVIIGKTARGSRKGCPTIGDVVHLSVGAKVLGRIHIGSNVVVGANAVVVDDVPDGAVVAGIPARVISHEGSEGYVRWAFEG